MDVPNINGKTPVDLAIQETHGHCVQFLQHETGTLPDMLFEISFSSALGKSVTAEDNGKIVSSVRNLKMQVQILLKTTNFSLFSTVSH